MKRIASTALWGALLIALAGCSGARWLTYVFTPRQEKKVAAEYPGLVNSKVAVVVYVDESTQFEYPRARLTIAATCGAHLKEHVKGIVITRPLVVSRYLDEHLHWDTMPKRELCEGLDVDFVVMITLEEFATRAVGTMSSYQTTINGAAKVYERLSPHADRPVWSSSKNIESRWPAQPSYDPAHEAPNREIAEQKFAAKVAKLFYDHTVIIETKEDLEE